jgi:hypothetical protein
MPTSARTVSECTVTEIGGAKAWDKPNVSVVGSLHQGETVFTTYPADELVHVVTQDESRLFVWVYRKSLDVRTWHPVADSAASS